MDLNIQLQKLGFTNLDIEDLEDQEMFGQPFSPVSTEVIQMSNSANKRLLRKLSSFKLQTIEEKTIIENSSESLNQNEYSTTFNAELSAKCEGSFSNNLSLPTSIQAESLKHPTNLKLKSRKTIKNQREEVKNCSKQYLNKKTIEEKDYKKILRKSHDYQQTQKPSPLSTNLDNEFVRWGTEKDCELYRYILELQSNNVCSINKLVSLSRPVPINFKKILWDICEKTKWRGPTFYMLRRIQRIFKDHEFSVRQFYLLKRIIRKEYHYKNLDYYAIGLHFPGKSIDSIINNCNQILIEKGKMA